MPTFSPYSTAHNHDANYATATHDHDADYLGITAKAADSDKLDGVDSTGFATADHNHNSDYLGITATAAESDKVDGAHASATPTAATIPIADANGLLDGWVTGGGGGVTDHGALTGLSDDDHPQYVKHDLATAASDFLVASGVGAFVKKTLAEVKTLLGLGTAAYTDSTDYLGATATAADSNKLGGMSASMYSVPARVIPFTDDNGYLSSAFIPQAGNANTVDTAHASATPTASTIPIADAGGKLANGWLPDLSATYLPVAGKAADSDLLDSHDTSYFATASHSHVGLYVSLAGSYLTNSTTWTWQARSTTGKTLIDLSAVFGAPDGIKAIHANLGIRDSGAASADCWLILSDNNSNFSGTGVDCHPVGDRILRTTMIVPCDANGDIYYQCASSGTNTLDVLFQIIGYWI